MLSVYQPVPKVSMYYEHASHARLLVLTMIVFLIKDGINIVDEFNIHVLVLIFEAKTVIVVARRDQNIYQLWQGIGHV